MNSQLKSNGARYFNIVNDAKSSGQFEKHLESCIQDYLSCRDSLDVFLCNILHLLFAKYVDTIDIARINKEIVDKLESLSKIINGMDKDKVKALYSNMIRRRTGLGGDSIMNICSYNETPAGVSNDLFIILDKIVYDLQEAT